MYCEGNYMTYVEEGEGWCCSVMLKLRQKKHTLFITVLLILAIVSVVSGLYNGLIVKKHSDLTLVIGIFFPSFILIVVCVYLAFHCGRDSFRRSILSRHLPNENHSRQFKVDSQYPQINTCRDLRAKCQPKASTVSINGSVTTRNEGLHSNKIFYTTDYSAEPCENKISRKHFRNFSNSDSSKQTHGNYDTLSNKLEMCEVNYRTTTDDSQYSSNFGRYQDVTQRKKFKRSVSDTTNKNRNKKLKKDKPVWNTQSLENLRRHVDKLNSEKKAEGQSVCNFSCETIKKPSENSYPLKNYKTVEDHKTETRFKECSDDVQRCRNRQCEYVDTMSSQEYIRKKRCYTKSEILLYSSNALKLPDECKQSFRFSNLPLRKNENNDTEDTANCSSEDEKNCSFLKSNSPEMKRNRERVKSSSSEQDTYRLRRKDFYFPSTNSNELPRPLKEYAHELCRHSRKDSKMTQRPLSRNESFDDYQNSKQVRYHWR